MEKILTVVIPTYNIEKYLRECLDSFVLPKWGQELEVLIIDDGSTDHCGEIAEEYERKMPETFRVIHKENGGHGSTINRGIQEACGKYFKVVDGDDYVDKKAFVNLLQCLKKTDSDLVATNYYWLADGTKKVKSEIRHPFDKVIYGRKYQFSEIGSDAYFKMHAVTFRTQLLKQYMPKIDEHCYYVDMEFILFPIPYVETVTCLDEYVYRYRIGLPTQSMNLKGMQKHEQNFDRVLERLLAYYDQKKAEKIPQCYLTYMESILARMVSSRFKIFLSYPICKREREKMVQFDRKLKRQHPDVYARVTNKAVWMLRYSSYRLYPAAKKVFDISERWKNRWMY
ncbi:MAG: glycosyltransferase family A protein [Lachnospiraceae bacterium]|nr:glycosyltransferase family 2 protein [Robinsoniella sp.]MDY3765204.1 glycosyltransferase family A protein [Lachnospiraceae bacterium]